MEKEDKSKELKKQRVKRTFSLPLNSNSGDLTAWMENFIVLCYIVLFNSISLHAVIKVIDFFVVFFLHWFFILLLIINYFGCFTLFIYLFDN